jgi:hypothetical protein
VAKRSRNIHFVSSCPIFAHSKVTFRWLENADRTHAATASRIHRVSRTVTLPKVDGRSTLGKLMRQVRADLIRHVGGKPSATQKMLIERAVTLTGYLARLDAEALSPAGLSDHRRREYLAADGSLRRTLREIGLEGAERKPSLTPLEEMFELTPDRHTGPR